MSVSAIETPATTGARKARWLRNAAPYSRVRPKVGREPALSHIGAGRGVPQKNSQNNPMHSKLAAANLLIYR